MTERSRRRALSTWLEPGIPFACLAMLFLGFVIDINTDQAIVVAIAFNIPIAISGALLSRRLTIWVTTLAVLAAAAAGWANSVDADVSGATMLNRVLVCLSFLIVAAMTLLFERSSEDVHELENVEAVTERERNLRRFFLGLSGPLSPDELFQSTALGLKDLLEADSVVLTTVENDRFVEPRWSAPQYTSVAAPGTSSEWLIDSLPITATPVITVRDDAGITSVGEWRSEGEVALYVVAERPHVSGSSDLLAEALEGLRPLRQRSIELQRLRELVEASDHRPE